MTVVKPRFRSFLRLDLFAERWTKQELVKGYKSLRTWIQWSSGSVSRFHTTGSGSILGLGKVDSAFHPYCSGSINEYQACVAWRRSSNLELYRSYKESDIVNFIKIQRIKWAGHVIRMNKDCTTKKIFNAQPTGTRRKGSPNLRGFDGLEKNLLVLRTRNWGTLARRLACKRLLKKAKDHPGLSCL
ncbi:uncharacterized protein TNCV_4638041 [Trichonephila clavipes]|uniref:Uncharacterized protein n=1 Tax=Trichonephila clavipes TaxID=2585209 RepID=A0A8X6WD44_TRICX|nr:uncharacterized protein TNCV_4638041 [Trichonephila clavipes]